MIISFVAFFNLSEDVIKGYLEKRILNVGTYEYMKFKDVAKRITQYFVELIAYNIKKLFGIYIVGRCDDLNFSLGRTIISPSTKKPTFPKDIDFRESINIARYRRTISCRP